MMNENVDHSKIKFGGRSLQRTREEIQSDIAAEVWVLWVDGYLEDPVFERLRQLLEERNKIR